MGSLFSPYQHRSPLAEPLVRQVQQCLSAIFGVFVYWVVDILMRHGISMVSMVLDHGSFHSAALNVWLKDAGSWNCPTVKGHLVN